MRARAALSGLAMAIVLAGCGASSGPSTTDPGLLPPTSGEPPASGVRVALTPVWSAIMDDDPSAAHATFLPRSAYLRIKADRIRDPSADYAGRLLALYDQDIDAYHQELGPDPSKAVLVSIDADMSYASWIPPGACTNAIGYWHLPGARVVYRLGGRTLSFGVTSLISWRATWYVVHLGPNPRPFPVGGVDLPERGAGTPGPAGGC